MRLTRRQTLRTLGSTLSLALIGGAVHVLQRTGLDRYPLVRRSYDRLVGLLRPPGALPEAGFLAACIRCYRCQDVCTPGAIQFYTERHGSLYHTPYVNPALKGCTLCLKCGPVCPTGALAVVRDIRDVDMGSVELNEDACLSYRAQRLRDEQDLLTRSGRSFATSASVDQRRGPCGECYMFCPLREQAITLRPGWFLAPLVHPAECVGCGMCEEICRDVLRGQPAIRVVRTRRPLHGQQEVCS